MGSLVRDQEVTRLAHWSAFGLGLLVGLSLVAHAGCGPSRRPAPPGRTAWSLSAGAETLRSGDAERIQTAVDAWDGAGFPPLSFRVELRDPVPESLTTGLVPPQPYIYLVRNGQPAGLAIAFTDGISVVCTRGEEWAIVHELLHVLHVTEGRPAEFHVNPAVEDPRWELIRRLEDVAKARMP